MLSVLAAIGLYVMFCGAWSAPSAVSACCTWLMCHVLWCLEHTWCCQCSCCQCLLHLTYVLAICGAWSAPMYSLYVLWGA